MSRDTRGDQWPALAERAGCAGSRAAGRKRKREARAFGRLRGDGSWSWKDEDELEIAVAAGFWTEDEARAFRAEGERVLAEWPFPTGWEDWRPDPSWPLPALPSDWDA